MSDFPEDIFTLLFSKLLILQLCSIFVPFSLGVTSLCNHETHTYKTISIQYYLFWMNYFFFFPTNDSAMLAFYDKASVKAYVLYLTIYSVLKMFISSQMLEKQQQIQKCQLHAAIAKLKQSHWNEVFWAEWETNSSKPNSVVWLLRTPSYTNSHSKAHSSKKTLVSCWAEEDDKKRILWARKGSPTTEMEEKMLCGAATSRNFFSQHQRQD